MKILIWLIVLPVVLVAAFFAIANRDVVTVDLWPFWQAVSLPLFAALAGALYFGILIGALIGWWGGRHARARARAEHRRAEILTQENAALQTRLDQLAPKPPSPLVDLTPAPPAKPLPPAWKESERL